MTNRDLSPRDQERYEELCERAGAYDPPPRSARSNLAPPDDAETRFALIELGTAPPVVEGEGPPALVELTKDEELRRLRARCGELEKAIAARPLAAIRPTLVGEEKHGVQCGFHANVVVSTNSPKVWCAICGTELEALAVLREFANRERNFVYGMEGMRRTVVGLKAEIEALTKTRNNLRSQVRRGERREASNDSDRVADLPVASGRGRRKRR